VIGTGRKRNFDSVGRSGKIFGQVNKKLFFVMVYLALYSNVFEALKFVFLK
jgi:hypothetical protein